MFPYNYNIPFSMPYTNSMMGVMPRMGMVSGLRNGLGPVARTGGLFSKITGGVRGVNWQGLLSNVSRTLNVINQAIPVVKQVGPMYNNMKSMLKIASLFKDETDPKPNNDNKIRKENIRSNRNSDNVENFEKENTIITNNYSNTPNFFI